MFGYKILRLVFFVLLAMTLLSGSMSFLLRGFIDFPCFVRYVKENDCLELPEHMQKRREVQNPRIETYLSTYVAGWKGAGCDYHATPDQSMELFTASGKLILQREDNSLFVNGQILEKGEEYHVSNIWNLHPWTIAQTKIYNQGVIPNCGAYGVEPRLVVTGSFGTKVNLVKGGLVLTILIAGIAMTNRKIKKLKNRKQLSPEPQESPGESTHP